MLSPSALPISLNKNNAKKISRRLKMEQRHLSALLSSLISQLLVVLLISNPLHNLQMLTSPSTPLFSLFILHLFTSSQFIASSIPSLLSRKRKRGPNDGEIDEDDENGSVNGVGIDFDVPDQFRVSFCMSAGSFEWLAGLLDPLLDCRDPAGLSLGIPSSTRLAVALSRLASGKPYGEVARGFGVSEEAARFCTKHLCRVICTNYRFWLAFPSVSDIGMVCEGFEKCFAGCLPGCCGAVACARFGVDGGGSSVAVQIVADSSYRILSIAAGFHGERSNWDILKCSSLYRGVEAGDLLGERQYFVGDGGHPLLPWLMVPFAEPEPGLGHEEFNESLREMWRPALRVVSSLRSWGALSRLIEEEDTKVAVACIGTCAILHNMLLMREDYSALADEVVDESCLGLEHFSENVALDSSVASTEALMLRNSLAMGAKEVGRSR